MTPTTTTHLQTRPFSGQNISEIGLGCWQLGGADWGAVDDASAYSILSAAVDAGINFFDTADVYGSGRSETLIGRFLKGISERIFVATKIGRTAELFPNQYTPEAVRAAVEACLKRLQVEALDLVQLHCIPEVVLRQGDVFEWLRQLKHEGKILRFGASVESMAGAEICLAQPGTESLQIIFNIFRQKPITTLFPTAEARQVGIIVRLPLASGLLAGKFSRESVFPTNDHRAYNRDGQKFNVGETFAGLPFEKGVELSEALKAYVPEGMTMAQMAQRWILDHKAVTTVITGASRPAQVAENASVSKLPALPAELHAKLRSFYEESVTMHIRGPY